MLCKNQIFGWVCFCFLLVNIPANAFATSPGPYVGVQLGWANVHQGDYIARHLNDLIEDRIPGGSSVIDSTNILYSNTGLAGRLFAGYQFNRYFATEVGYYRFSQLNVNTHLNLTLTILKKYNLPVDAATHARVNTYVVDWVGKGILPVTDKFSLYGKLGLAYLNANGKVNINAKANIYENIDAKISLSANPSLNVIYPTFGLGMNYDFTQHVSGDFSWSRIQQYNSKCFPSIDFVGLGLLYHFN